MKKRILSLILAFAMAATLAPATALVGTSVSKAAVTNINLGTAEGDITLGTSPVSLKFTNSSGGSGAAINLKAALSDTAKAAGIEIKTATVKNTDPAVNVLSNLTGASGHDLTNVDTDEENVLTLGITMKTSTPAGKTYAAGLVITGPNSEKITYNLKTPARSNGVLTGTSVVNVTMPDPSKIDGGSTIASTITTIDKAAASFAFDITDAGDNDIKSVSLSYGIGSDQPKGGNLSFSVVEDKENNKWVATAANLAKLTPGLYKLNLNVRKGTETTASSIDIIKFMVSNKYKVTLDFAGGKHDSFIPDEKGRFTTWSSGPDGGDSTVDLPSEQDMSRPGYYLKGWKASKEYAPGTADVKVTADTVFTAVWVSDDFQINLIGGENAVSSNGSVGNDTAEVVLGKSLKKNPFTKVGSSFVGWTNVEKGGYAKYADGIVITEKVLSELRESSSDSLYAIWAPITYTINFDINLPEGAKASTYNTAKEAIKKKYNDKELTAAQAASTFAVNNMSWTGWSLDKEGYNVITTLDDVNINPEGKTSVTLYAQWKDGNSVVVYTNDYEAASNKVYAVVDESKLSTMEEFRVGYTREDFTYKDGSLVSGVLDYDDNGIAVVYPSYGKADEWNIKGVGYDKDGKGNLTTAVNRLTINSGNIAFPQVKDATGYSHIGWTLDQVQEDVADVDAMVEDGFDYEKVYVGSFNAEEMIKAITKYNTNGDATAKQFSFTAVYLDISTDVKWKTASPKAWDDTVVFDYGTTKAAIEKLIKDDLEILDSSNPNGTGAKINNGIGRVEVTTNPRIYDSMPKDDVTYTITRIRVYPDSNYVANSKFYDLDKNPTNGVIQFKVQDNPGDGAIYAKSMTSVSDIKMAAGANGYDLFDTITYESQNVTFTCNDNKKYTWNLASAGSGSPAPGTITYYEAYDRTVSGVLADQDEASTYIKSSTFPGFVWVHYQFDKTNNGQNAYSEIAIKGTSTTTIKAALGLQDAWVKVLFTDKPYADLDKNDDKDEEKEEELEKELTKAQNFLAQGYALRVFNKVNGSHYFYTSLDELKTLLSIPGNLIVHETEATTTFKASNAKTAVFNTPVYRLSTKNNGGGVHYTTTTKERDYLVGKGWTWDKANYNDDGAIFYVSNDSNGARVYRMVNYKLNCHHFALEKEYKYLMNLNIGWEDETAKDPTNSWYTPAN